MNKHRHIYLMLIISFLVQIQKSPQAHAFFCHSCQEVNTPVLKLLKWICTWWASLFNFLDLMLILHEVDKFSVLGFCLELMYVSSGCQPIYIACWQQYHCSKPPREILCRLQTWQHRMEEDVVHSWSAPGMLSVMISSPYFSYFVTP